VIRPATRADLDRIVQAQLRLNEAGTAADPRYQLRPDAARALREHLGFSWFERFLPFPACLLALEPDGSEGADRLVGLISGEVVPEHPVLAYPPTARIDGMWVEPDRRRSGLGRSLVAAFRAGAAKAGFHRITVSTLAKDARAVAFWRSVGFDDLNLILALG
jgi:ribosomal protein S18 acetylase RimI-like enzyme